MLGGRKAPTIQDVAREASVSTATVSRALSNPDRVSESTRQRVDEAIRATGYTLNQAARSLRKRATRTILVALPNIGNPFFSVILEAIEGEAVARDYNVLVANRRDGVDQDARLLDLFLSNRVDGMIMLDGAIDPSRFRRLSSDPARLPLVIACEGIPDSRLRTVKTDNELAAQRATEHLIELGHTKIAHITGPAGNVLTEERERGYHAALATAEIASRPEWIIPGDFRMSSGAAAAHTIAALGNGPTAVFSANDEMAIGLISELRLLGSECPRDISVVGFDDIMLAGRYSPPLTTMRQPREQLGRLAAETLFAILEGTAPPQMPDQVVLESQLVVRGSTMRACSTPDARTPVPPPDKGVSLR